MDSTKRVPSTQNTGRMQLSTGGSYGRVGETRSPVARGKAGGMRVKDSSSAPHPTQLLQLACESPIDDLIQWVRELHFPASCKVALQLLERYVKADMGGDCAGKVVPPKDVVLTLADIFVLHIRPASQAIPPSSSDKNSLDVLNPAEEVQLLLTLKAFLEGLGSVELRFSLFEALFGRATVTEKVVQDVDTEGDVLKRLTSLAVSLESTAILCSVGLWMQLHQREALSLAHSLYYDFCVLIPDAMAPLLSLVTVSPHMAEQMALAFTSLHPLYIVGSAAPEVDPAHLNPPIKLLEILTHWLETSPEFLFPPQLLSKPLEQLSIHTQRLKPLPSPTLLAGLIQWCVLAPLVPRHQVPRGTVADKNGTITDVQTISGTGEHQNYTDFESLTAKLHADLLSVVLSHSKSFHKLSLTSDNVAMIVAALLGLSRQLRGRESGGGKMNEAVERLSQFLQITLSTGILVLKPDDLSSMASTLPENRLLNLVIAHHCR